MEAKEMVATMSMVDVVKVEQVVKVLLVLVMEVDWTQAFQV